jgi:hypothetical protein
LMNVYRMQSGQYTEYEEIPVSWMLVAGLGKAKKLRPHTYSRTDTTFEMPSSSIVTP